MGTECSIMISKEVESGNTLLKTHFYHITVLQFILYQRYKRVTIKWLFCFSVKTDLLTRGAISRLSIAFASNQDSGNYTCSMRSAQASVIVHILNGMDIDEINIYVLMKTVCKE